MFKINDRVKFTEYFKEHILYQTTLPEECKNEIFRIIEVNNSLDYIRYRLIRPNERNLINSHGVSWCTEDAFQLVTNMLRQQEMNLDV